MGGACEIQFVDKQKLESVRCTIKPAETVNLLAEIFKIPGDSTRSKIAFALPKEELCVCDIANLSGVSQSVVSRPLRTLWLMKLVKFRREGK